jgi:altronate hydrolase
LHQNANVMRVSADDTVAVALAALEAGTRIILDGVDIIVREPVAKGHKLAVTPHRSGDRVIKYGHPIGRATASIEPGQWVHSHNLATALAGEVGYARGTGALSGLPRIHPEPTWRGYLRADDRAATRNEIWVLPTVGCVGLTAEQVALAAGARHRGSADGIHAFTHPHGCSQLGDDLAATRAALAGLATNPNAAGVLLLGLGCESNQLAELIEAVPPAARGKLRILAAQAEGDEIAAAGRLVDELVETASAARRSDLPLSALTVGLKCGGSDAFSGLTANPLLGRFSDRFAAAGGRLILTEIPEIFGAEQALLDRAADAATFAAAAALINRFKRYFLDAGQPVSENPSPGNLAGGITTLEEKSLGAVQKAGHAPLAAVAAYGGPVTTSGLTLLEAPGNDAVSATALAAAGATLSLFTTGRGTPLGFPVPTLKIASNSSLAQAKSHWIDFDAGRAMTEDLAALDADFLERILAIAGGEPCAAERAGQRSIAIWKRGVTL